MDTYTIILIMGTSKVGPPIHGNPKASNLKHEAFMLWLLKLHDATEQLPMVGGSCSGFIKGLGFRIYG